MSDDEEKEHFKRPYGDVKFYYTCPSCEIVFRQKKHLKEHLRRKIGCKSPSEIMGELMLDKLNDMDKCFEIYDIFYLTLSPADKKHKDKILDRYNRLYYIKNKIIKLNGYINNFCKKLYDDDKKRDCINKILREYDMMYEERKKQYINDKKMLVEDEL